MIDLTDYPKTSAGLLLGLAYVCRQAWMRSRKQRAPLPPGPRGYPIIGNLFDISRPACWTHYSDLSKEYGDIIYLESLGTKIIVLSTYKRITEVLEERSSIYSSRPEWPMINGVMGYDKFLSNAPYGHTWRRQRRLFHEAFGPPSMPQYHPMMYREIRRLAQELQSTPDEFLKHIRTYLNRVIVKSTYGFDVQDENHPYIKIVMEAAIGFIEAAVPGRFLVDLIPALKYVPSWFPGAGWKRWALHHRESAIRAMNEPFDWVLDAWHKGTAEPCAVTRMLEKLPSAKDPTRKFDEYVARSTTGTGFIAGSDTTFGTAATFILLMAMHPEVQLRAQAEIDEAMGFSNLPTIEDIPGLVYLQAILREVLRWQTEFPLGVPHASTEDDVYDGYFIPKGTLIIPNIWHLMKTTAVFDNPQDFKPERHIKDGKINPDIFDPYLAAFGFGRRICPGRYFSLDSLHLMLSMILSLFQITPPVDEEGNSVLKWSFGIGLLNQPDPFDCIVKPRTEKHAQVIATLL